MDKTPSFLAVESLMELSKKASEVKCREYEENDRYCFYRNFVNLSWYSRLNVINFKEKDEKELLRIKGICLEASSPKYLSFTQEDCYEGFKEDIERIGFIPVKPQKGMLYDMKNAPEYEENENVIAVDKKNLDQWVWACEQGFSKSGIIKEHQLFIKDKDCRYFGYVVNGKIVSCAMLNICGKNGGVHEVATPVEYRGNGYATAVLKRLIEEAKREGMEILSLQASVFGEPVYKKLGFEVVSQIYNYKI